MWFPTSLFLFGRFFPTPLPLWPPDAATQKKRHLVFLFSMPDCQMFLYTLPWDLTASCSCLSHPPISSSHPECGRQVLFPYRAVSENICLYRWETEGKRQWFPPLPSLLQWLMLAEDGRHLDSIPLPIWAHGAVCQALRCCIYSQFT